MNLILASDFPSTPNPDVLARMQSVSTNPRVAWIPPTTPMGRERFPAAQALFRSFGVPRLEYCDTDAEPNDTQLALLDDYDVVYLTGGDPLVFRRNLRRHGLAERLRARLASGGLIVGASGGAMQLTSNVSLFRLLARPVEEVAGDHAEYDGLGMVDYELLPHLNRHDASFLEKVGRSSVLLPHDVVALDDGAALIYEGSDDCRYAGRAVRYRAGIEIPTGT